MDVINGVVLAVSGSFALAAVWITWCYVLDAVRATVRRRRVHGELMQMAARRARERHLRAASLTGTRGLRRSEWEGGHDDVA